MSKPNKDGWIRHRGGKCPVEVGTLVDVRYRSGMVNEHVKALESVHPDGSVGLSAVTWGHYGSIHDIMAYRIHKPAEQPAPVSEPVERKCEGRACEMPDAENHSKECLLDAAIDQGWAGPLQWRDRITEIDRTVEALEEERVALVQRLEAEGFRLIDRTVQPVEDMSDCKKVKVGDFVKFINESNDEFTKGRIYEVLAVDSSQAPYDVIDDEGDENCLSAHECEFHFRPSK